MGLEQVVQDIHRETEARVKQILDLAHQEAADVLAEARQKAADYEASRLAQADRDGAQQATQVQSNAEFEARKHVLAAEAELRDELRQKVLEGFAALPAKTRQKHATALLKQAKETISSGRVWGAKKDLTALGKQKSFEVAGETDIAGGIIVESEDGRIRLDLSYETLLDGMWRDVLRQEAGLFA